MPGYREEPLPPLPVGRPVADDEIIVHGPPTSNMNNGSTPRMMPPMMQQPMMQQPMMQPMGPPMGQMQMGMPDEGPYGQVPMQPMTPPPQMSGDHIPLAKCRVLYLGSAVPLETATGLEAVQQPLKERYAMNPDSGEVPGIDVRLTAFSSGLQMQYADDPATVVWFPIQQLHVCAGVKCIQRVDNATGERQARFVPLDSAEGARSSHPPLFTCIMRRTVGIKVLECHAFLCKTKDSAMALVQSTTHAYQHRELWRDDAPTPPDAQGIGNQAHLVPAEVAPATLEAPPEFYEKPPLQGYYYSSSKDLVRNFNVAGGRRRPPAGAIPPGMTAGPVRPGMTMMMPPQRPDMEPMPMMMPPPPGSELMPPGVIMASPYGPLPVPPAGYFTDWAPNGIANPVAVFPGGPYRTEMPRNRRSSRRRRRHRDRRSSPSTRRKSPSPVHRKSPQPRRRRSASPQRQSRRQSPPRRPSPRRQSPARHNQKQNGNRTSAGDYSYPDANRRGEYSDDYSEYSDSGSGSSYTYSDSESESYDSRAYERSGYTQSSDGRRPRTPPADYDRRGKGGGGGGGGGGGVGGGGGGNGGGGGGGGNDRYQSQIRRQNERNGDDLELYAPRYARNMPNRRSAREDSPYRSSFNPDIEFREGKDLRREESDRRRKSSKRNQNGNHASRYPRSDREFGRSIREEHRALGESGAYDARDRRDGDNDSQLNYDMFQQAGSKKQNGRDSNFNRLEQSLGYYP